MACYDCEDCPKQQDSGGKCTRWEYNCPFHHLSGRTADEKEKIDEDLKTAKELKAELSELINKFKDRFNNEYYYREILEQLNFAYSNIEDMVDEELVKEWQYINE